VDLVKLAKIAISPVLGKGLAEFEVAFTNPKFLDAVLGEHLCHFFFQLKSSPTGAYGWESPVGRALEMRNITLIPLGRLRTSVSI
jgi:hypothetical protein